MHPVRELMGLMLLEWNLECSAKQYTVTQNLITNGNSFEIETSCNTLLRVYQKGKYDNSNHQTSHIFVENYINRLDNRLSELLSLDKRNILKEHFLSSVRNHAVKKKYFTYWTIHPILKLWVRFSLSIIQYNNSCNRFYYTPCWKLGSWI